MPKIRRSTGYRLVLSVDRKPHTLTSRQWRVYLSAGVIVVVAQHPRLARLRDARIEVAFNADGTLQLIDHAADCAPTRTNSQVIDRLWLLADAGQVTLTADERARERAIRQRFEPQVAREVINDLRARQRDWRMRAQYGW